MSRAIPADWEVVIGLEVHAQMKTRSKLFSPAPTTFGGEANDHVSPIDAALPGMLPILNRACVDLALRVGMALGATIHDRSIFARKNYFYPDLPQGYQISQYEHPIIGAGRIQVTSSEGTPPFDVGIVRAHLEQDAGKLMHDQVPHVSLVDLNRCGIPLLEIVTEPDLRSAEQASAALAHLRSLLRWIDACDGNMQEGSLRADVNVSVRRKGDDTLGTRTEIKNLNSLRFLRQAIEVEALRQIDVIQQGGRIVQQTRLFDPDRLETRALRSKEDARDYRYFPDPDLPVLEISESDLKRVRALMPPLPEEVRARYIEQWGVRFAEASLLTDDRKTAGFFDRSVHAGGEELAPSLARWLTTELFSLWSSLGCGPAMSPVDPVSFAELVRRVECRDLTVRVAKEALSRMAEQKETIDQAVEALGGGAVVGREEVETLVQEIVRDHPKPIEQYLLGKTAVYGWLVGQVMKATRGRAHPEDINTALKRVLDGLSVSSRSSDPISSDER